MKKFYSLLIVISVASAAMAQPTQPAAPISCNANSCTTSGTIDVCPPGGNTVVSSFTGGAYNRGGTGQLTPGAVWRFRNIATVSGVTVNAEITVNAISNAVLDAMDDNTAVDQNNASISSFLAPRIGPDQNLNATDRRGYVEFIISFFRSASGTNNGTNSDFAQTVNLLNINYVHYDIDGSTVTGQPSNWFRETGVAKKITATNPQVLANATTELVAYSYTQASDTWSGFAGSVCERDNISRCAQLASSFAYLGAFSSITVRLGYDYNAGGGNLGNTVRQYGTRIGCFNFPDQITLPVKLLAFSASYRTGQSLVSWTTENEVNFSHYEVERSTNGKDFVAVGTKSAEGSYIRKNYQFTDDISTSLDKVFYYRLRMVDIDGKYSFSNVILIRKDQEGSVKGLLLSPNPVSSSSALTLRIQTHNRQNVDIRVLDVTGKLVLKQQNQLSEGLNSVSLNNQNRLQPGIYTVQVIADDEVLSSKLSVIR